MSVALYLDVNVSSAIVIGLRQRGVDLLTAQENGADMLLDEDLLDRALSLSRALFTHDHDFLRIAANRQRNAMPFAGIIYVHQNRLPLRKCIDDLELISKVEDSADWLNRLEYLPL